MELSSYGSEAAPANWVVNITELLKEKDAIETPVCILKARKILRDIKPEDYSPKLIGLGPYHHWRHDLYEMELYKLISAKKAAENDQRQPVEVLEGLADRLMGNCIPHIRACYDHNLDVGDRELAWMMVIDAIFLLQFLQAFVHKERSYLRDYKRMSYLVDPTQSAYHSILKDMMKLENQIPMIVLKEITSGSALNVVIHGEHSLLQLLTATCNKLSPLKLVDYEVNYSDNVNKPSHLLDLLYHLIVPPEFETDQHQLPHLKEDRPPHPKYEQHTSSDNLGDHQQGNRCKNCLSNINITDAVVQLFKNLNLQLVNLRIFKFIAKLTEVLLPAVLSSRQESSSTSNGGAAELAPTLEEIEIPSASQLLDVGVKFCPSDGSPITSCISFDKRTRKFHLPIIHIDGNTEVIMRNLVAYEGAAIPGSLVLARYTELMNGIIDTPKDVRLLRERGIIVSFLKRDEDVSNMWNLMSRSIRLSHVPSIDKAINEVNDYYASKKRVRLCRFTKDCLFCCWKILTLFLALLLLLLMFIQSFCDVYKCSRIIAASGGSQTKSTSLS